MDAHIRRDEVKVDVVLTSEERFRVVDFQRGVGPRDLLVHQVRLVYNPRLDYFDSTVEVTGRWFVADGMGRLDRVAYADLGDLPEGVIPAARAALATWRAEVARAGEL